MNYTENLTMKLPQYGENADVADINYNTEKLDTYVYNNRQMQAPEYNTQSTYNTGDIVTHNGALYICLADNVTGAWDSTKWSATTLAEQIELAKQSGGESALADLEDVNLTNPSNGQLLQYNGSEWVNGDVTVTKTASGNPVEFTDGADAPLVKCTTAITGSQNLHGYDKPWVGGAGKNKLPMNLDDIKANNPYGGTWSGNTFTTNDGLTITIITDNAENVIGLKVNGTATAQYDFKVKNVFNSTSAFVSSGTYTASMPQNGTNAVLLCGYGSTAILNNTTKTTETTTDGLAWVLIRFSINSTFNDTIFQPMIRISTVSDPTFEPYSNICPITAYTEGEIEVRGKNMIPPDFITHPNETAIRAWHADSGVEGTFLKSGTYTFFSDKGRANGLYVNKYKDGTATTIFTKYNATYFTFTLTEDTDGISLYLYFANGGADDYGMELVEGAYSGEYEPYSSTTHSATFTQAIYQGNADFVGGKARATWGYIASYNGETLPGEWISSMDEYAPGTTPTTGAQVAYELASPTEETITPTNLPIKSLFGYNHIESSTGEMEIEYITEGYQPLVDLIQSGNGHTYSTQEQVVGTWIDGQTLYEKTYTNIAGTGSGTPSITVDADIKSNSGNYNVKEIKGLWSIGDFGYTVATTQAFGEIGIMDQASMTVYGRVTPDGLVVVPSNANYGFHAIMTIRYTKTTQSRSLSKSAEPEEPTVDKVDKVDKVDELKEEPVVEEEKEPEVKEEQEESKK